MGLVKDVAFYVLTFNAVIVLIILIDHILIGRHKKIKVDFEGYLSSLDRNATFLDPYILVDGKWVETNKRRQHTNPPPKDKSNWELS